jgi:hypothetical protein
MNRVQEQKYHLAISNRQIAQLAVQIVRQRVIVKHALATGQHLEMAESLLDALEGSLRLFEKHRIFLLSCNGSSRARRRVTPRRAGACHDTTGVERHDKAGAQISRLCAYFSVTNHRSCQPAWRVQKFRVTVPPSLPRIKSPPTRKEERIDD